MTTKDHIISTINSHKADLHQYGVSKVGLFGSYVRSKQTKNSDIDLLIDFKPDQENFDNFMGLCDYLTRLFENEKVEIVTQNGLSPYIGPKILKEVLYVYRPLKSAWSKKCLEFGVRTNLLSRSFKIQQSHLLN